jgi:hypothetical protein
MQRPPPLLSDARQRLHRSNTFFMISIGFNAPPAQGPTHGCALQTAHGAETLTRVFRFKCNAKVTLHGHNSPSNASSQDLCTDMLSPLRVISVWHSRHSSILAPLVLLLLAGRQYSCSPSEATERRHWPGRFHPQFLDKNRLDIDQSQSKRSLTWSHCWSPSPVSVVRRLATDPHMLPSVLELLELRDGRPTP